MIRAFAVAGILLVCLGLACGPEQPAFARQSATPAPSGSSTPTPQAAKPKPRKVWTEENLGEAGGTISVVGDPNSASTGPAAQSHPARPAPPRSAEQGIDARTLATLRQQLQKLQSNLDLVDRQLAQLKGFSKGDGKNAGGLQADTWQYNSSSVEEQLLHLQEKKANLRTAIDNLLDAARRSGIEPGQLR